MFNSSAETGAAGPRPWRRRALVAALAAGGALVLLAGIAHLPPVRSRVLGAALGWTNARFGVEARARGLDYNLLTLRFALDGPTVAARHAIDKPFFAADRVEVDLPWTWFWGARALQALRIDGPRLTIATDDADRFNLPTIKGGAGGGSLIEIDELALRDISLVVDDRIRRIGLQVQRASLRLSGSRDGTFDGRLRMGAPGALRVDGWATTLIRLDATLGLRGRELRVTPLTIGTADGEISLSGTAGLSADAPLDLSVGAQVHLARLVASLAGVRVGGTVQVSGHATGTVAEPRAVLSLRAPAFTWGALASGVLAGELVASRHDLDIKVVTLGAPWGRVRASGRVADRDAGVPSRIDVAWSGLDAAGVAAAAGASLPLRIAAKASGSGTIAWPPGVAGALSLRASAALTPGSGPGLPVAGTVRVEKAGPQWMLTHDATGPGGLSASGRIGIGGGTGSPALSGATTVDASDLARALAALAGAGLDIAPEIVAAVDGSVHARVAFAGTTAAPRASIDASSERIRYAPLPDAQADARLVVDARRVTIGAATARFASGTARASDLTIDMRTGRLSGGVAADVRDLGPIASAFWPEGGPVTGTATADGRLSGTLDRPRVSAGVVALDVAAAGQRLDRLEGDVTYEEPRLAWREARAAQGAGTLATGGWIDLRRDQFEVSAEGTGLALGECPAAVNLCGGGVPLSASIDRLAVSAHGTFERPTGTLDLSAHDVRWKGENAGALAGRASLTDGSAAVSARLQDRGLRLAGTIGVPWPSPFDLTLTAADSEISTLLRVGGRAADAVRVAGSISATVRAVGDLDHLDQAAIDVSLPPASLVVDGRRWYTQQAARVEYSPARLAVSGVTLGIGESILAVTGGLGREGGETLTLALNGTIDDLVRAADLRDVDVTGEASGHFVVSGTPTAPLVAGTATVTAATVTHPKAAVSIERLTATLDGGMVRVERAQLASRGAHATIDAAVPVSLLRDRLPEAALRALGTPPRDARATLRADLSVNLADTGLLSDTSLPLEGSLAGRLDLEATGLSLDALGGTGIIHTADLAVGTSRIAQASPGRLTIDRGRVTLDAWTVTGSGSNLVAGGSIVLGGDGTLPVTATLKGPLVLEPLQALLGIPISGQVTTDVRVTGTATEPRAEGSVVLAGGGLRVRSPRVALADVRGSVRLDGTVAHFEGITGFVNGAPFTLGGSAVLPGAPSSGTHALRLEAQRVPVQPFATGPRAETDLDLTYTDDAGQRTVTGRADLLPQPFRGSVLALKQFVDAVGATSAPPGAAPRRRKPGTSPIKLKIAVDSREPLLVDTSAGRVELAARLTIEGSVDQPSLLGRVTVLEDGVIRAGGRKYTISSGTIDFTNPRRVVPLVNLTATTKISTYDITMVLAGTPDALRTSLNSDPPLSESDLRSLIVTGRIASQSMGRRDSESERTVVESISGDVLGFAAEAVGLDAVSIGNPDLDLLGSDIDAATSLNITKSVSRQVDVVYSRDLQDDRSAFLVIYRPTRAYSFRVLSRDNTEGAVEFRHELRFGGPPGAKRAAAAKSPKRPRIVSIAFTGDRGFSDAQLGKVLKLAVGSKFDTWQWRGETERLARLYRDSGFYAARIVPRRDAQGGGVALEYAITRGPRTTLAIDGHEMPDDVLEEMRDAWSESVSTAFLVEDLERLARTHLVDDGHLTPEVKAEVVVQTDAAQAVLLHVKAGPLVKSRQIDVEGLSSGMRPKLREFLDTSRLDRTAWYDPATLKAPVEAFFRERGHLEVKVTPGAVRIEGERAVIPVTVDEGRLFHVKRITVEGADGLGDEKVRKATGVDVGAPWEAAYLGRSRTNVEGAYDGAGFPDTEVYVESQVDAAAGEVTLYVAVAEGQRRVLQDLAISGTHDTLTKTVSDLVKLRFGDPVTPALISDVQKRLYDVGVFSRVAVDFEPAPGGSQATSTHDDPVVARVTVLEAPRYSVQYGLQVSKTLQATGTESEYKPGASVDFRDRNFLGRAMGLGIGTRFDARQKSGRVTFALPRTYGTSIRSYLFLDRSWETTIPEPGFETTDDQASISAEQRWRRNKNLEFSWGLAYDYRDLALTPVGDTGTDLLRIVGDTVGPRVAVVWDSRDDPFDSRRGVFHSSGLDVGLPTLGSDLSYSRYLIQNFLFVPKGPLVFASGLRYGGLAVRGSANPIVLDLLFKAGGSRSVRGYPEDSLSAVDIFGVPLGGQQMLVLNQEVRFPIWWWFRGATFVDAGNTFANAGTFALDKLKVGTGWGLRLATPVALIRFDVGYPLNDGPSHAPRYYLSIGQAF